jgi:hypothetical protein
VYTWSTPIPLAKINNTRRSDDLSGNSLPAVGEDALGVIDRLQLLQASIVLAIQPGAPLGLSELRINVVGETTNRSLSSSKGILKRLPEATKISKAVRGEVLDVNRDSIEANEPQVLAVRVCRVLVGDLAGGSTAPEVHEARSGEIGAVEVEVNIVEKDLDLLHREWTVGGRRQRLDVEVSSELGAATGLVL